MDLYSMIFKNIKYNIKNYIAYLLGNSFIIGILLMFFSLICSKTFMTQPDAYIFRENLTSILSLMVAFSIAFILYTTISFTKYRGKEFGVYLTIGLTSKNIIKILLYENFIVALFSFILGAIGGTIFSKLFYMAILKIIDINNIIIEISFKPYIYTAIIATLIFIFNMIYQIIFLSKLSIVEILKSSSKKYIGKSNLVIDVIALIIFIVSMIVFQKAINGEFEKPNEMIAKSFIAAIISLYFVIGFIMTLILKISKNFKTFYNNNILCLNSLSHRFVTYRTVLYIVILLVFGAMLAISIPYSTYKSVEKNIDTKYPYDLSFVAKKDLYKENFKDIIKNAGVEIKSYNELEGINVFNLQKSKDKVIFYGSPIMVVSESNYNKLNKSSVKINKGHAIQSYINTENLTNDGFIIDFSRTDFSKNDDYAKSTIYRLLNGGDAFSFNDYVKTKGNQGFLYIPKENIVDKAETITNTLNRHDDSIGYIRGYSIILNDEDYNKVKGNVPQNSIHYDILVNLNNNNNYKEINKNLEYKLNKIGGEKFKNTLVLKKEKLSEEINSDRFILFVASFLGIMLLIGSAAVLYFKIFTSLDDDKIRAKQLLKIGLTYKEIRNVIIKEIGEVFLVPPIMAILILGYYLSRIYKILSYGDYMWINSLVVFVIYGVIQIVFFLITINKYLREIRNNIY
ncbi:FtsX-like permease family protein [Clostridium lundense]|uniref:FtsX-like permease family protein n=1 Tax=Clostridium lundense TaxID=319475 RepID=UPI0004825466|nr:ABC transporter permease [Clostridium lundense]